jgi:hypothetical protein
MSSACCLFIGAFLELAGEGTPKNEWGISDSLAELTAPRPSFAACFAAPTSPAACKAFTTTWAFAPSASSSLLTSSDVKRDCGAVAGAHVAIGSGLSCIAGSLSNISKVRIHHYFTISH